MGVNFMQKKILSMLLALVMVIAIAPVSVFANSEIVLDDESVTYTSPVFVSSGETCRITGSYLFTGEVLVCPSATLIIEDTASVTFQSFFRNEGNLVIKDGSECILDETCSLENYGAIENADNIIIDGNLLNMITIPGMVTVDYLPTFMNDDPFEIDYAYSYYLPDEYDESNAEYYADSYITCSADTVVRVPYGCDLYLKFAPLTEPEGRHIDTGKVKLVATSECSTENIVIDSFYQYKDDKHNINSLYCMTVEDSYSISTQSLAYDDIVKCFSIVADSNIGYDIEAENGVDLNSVEIYSQPKFKINIHEDYSQSDYEVYLSANDVTAGPFDPDDDGYYYIMGPILERGMAMAGGIQQDITVIVTGLELNHTHHYEPEVKQPTCTEQGYTTYSCECGDSYISDYTSYCHKDSDNDDICDNCNKFVNKKQIKDDKNDVAIIFPDGAFDDRVKIEVTHVKDGDAYKLISHKHGNHKVTMFDIKVTVDGHKVQPNGAVLVKVPLPRGYNQNKCVVYYVADDGTMEELKTYHFKDGYVYFETDHFSYYAVVDETVQEEEKDFFSSIKEFFDSVKNFFEKLMLYFENFIKSKITFEK